MLRFEGILHGTKRQRRVSWGGKNFYLKWTLIIYF